MATAGCACASVPSPTSRRLLTLAFIAAHLTTCAYAQRFIAAIREGRLQEVEQTLRSRTVSAISGACAARASLASLPAYHVFSHMSGCCARLRRLAADGGSPNASYHMLAAC